MYVGESLSNKSSALALVKLYAYQQWAVASRQQSAGACW